MRLKGARVAEIDLHQRPIYRVIAFCIDAQGGFETGFGAGQKGAAHVPFGMLGLRGERIAEVELDRGPVIG